MSEIKIHKSLDHQHVVSFVKHFEDKDNVYIVLEICTNQSLNEMLKRRKKLTELEIKCYVKQLVLAISHLHHNKIIHRE